MCAGDASVTPESAHDTTRCSSKWRDGARGRPWPADLVRAACAVATCRAASARRGYVNSHCSRPACGERLRSRAGERWKLPRPRMSHPEDILSSADVGNTSVARPFRVEGLTGCPPGHAPMAGGPESSLIPAKCAGDRVQRLAGNVTSSAGRNAHWSYCKSLPAMRACRCLRHRRCWNRVLVEAEFSGKCASANLPASANVLEV
jgi:hypothetical protein